MKLRYLFTAILTAILFAGCSVDNEPTGALDEIVVSNTYVCIPATGGSAKFTVTAADDWKITNVIVNEETGKQQIVDEKGKATDLWFSISQLSGSNGATELTVSADAFDGGRESEIQIAVGGKKQFFLVRQGTMTATTATCAEVAAGSDGKTYRVKGTCTAIANTLYGNWYLNDGTGELYIYGTLDAEGKKQNFSSLNIEAGDVVEVEGPRLQYGSTIELVDVTVVSITKWCLKILSPEATVAKDGGELEVKVAYKGSGAYVNIPDDYASWIRYKSAEYIKGIPSKIEPTPPDTAVMKFDVLPNVGGARKGELEFSSSDGKNSTDMVYNFTQEGSIIPATCAEFNAAAVGSTQYRLTGIVTEVKSEKYGNLYIQDYTGNVYVYGTTNYSDHPVKAGDVVNIVGPRGEYKGSPQMVNGTIDEVYASAETVSLAEFNAAADDDNKYYYISGKITEIANDKYGNVYIEDATGEKTYLYGLYGDWAHSKQYFLKDNGIAVGDWIFVVTIKTSYKGTPQGKNAVCFVVAKDK